MKKAMTIRLRGLRAADKFGQTTVAIVLQQFCALGFGTSGLHSTDEITHLAFHRPAERERVGAVAHRK